MSEQSQGGMNGPTGDYPSQNPHYGQYGQQNIRGPGYPQSNMPGVVPPMRPSGGQGSGNPSMIPPGYNNPNQQRFMMGQTMPPQQQGGQTPTPTLNQLLQQNPTSGSQRYPGQGPGYGDYGAMGQQKGVQDISSGGQNYSSQGWNTQQRPVNPYQQQQMQGNQNFSRSQGQMYGGRPMNPGYPQHQSGSQYGQFSPNNPSRIPGQGKHIGMSQQYNQMSQPYDQQQNNYSQHNNYIPGGPPQQQSSQGGPPQQISPSQPSPHQTPPPNQSPAPPPLHHSPAPPPPPPLKSISSSSVDEQQSRPSSRQSDTTIPHANGIDGLKDESNDSSIHSFKQDGCISSSNEEQQHSNSITNSNNLDNNITSSSSNNTTSSSIINNNSSSNSSNSLKPPPNAISQQQQQTLDNSNNPTSHNSGVSQQQQPHSAAGGNTQQQQQPQRHIPSPASSTGSRSNTPASITANQTGSPMPPRPPSNQVDGIGQTNSTMNNQGYGQHMMPPPMGHSQMPYGTPGKIPQNMMGGPPMASYNQSYPPNQQGNYGRGMPGYGSQSYNGPSPSSSTHMYGGMNRGMPGSYPNQYSQQQQGSMGGGQYGQYNNQPQSNMVPPSKMGPGGGVPMNHMGQSMPNSSMGHIGPNSNMGLSPGQNASGMSAGGGGPGMVPPNSSSSLPSSGGAVPPTNMGAPGGQSPGSSSNASISPNAAVSKSTPPHQGGGGASGGTTPPAVSMNSGGNAPRMPPGPTASEMLISGPKGAQAAAHAAMVAAANQSQINSQRSGGPGFEGSVSSSSGSQSGLSPGQVPPPQSQQQQQQQQHPGQYGGGRGMYGQYSASYGGGGGEYNQNRGPNMMGDRGPPGGGGGGYPGPNASGMGDIGGGGHMSMASSGNNSMMSSGGMNSMGGGMGSHNMNGMPMHSSSNMSRNSTLPPNAVAPPNGPVGNNMGPPPMGPPMGPPMPPPSTVPGSYYPGKSMDNSPSQIKMEDGKMDVKPAVAVVSSISGDCTTTTTQSLSSPITNTSTTSSGGGSQSSHMPAYVHIKDEVGSQDESSQDSIKFKPDSKRDGKDGSTSHPATPSLGSQPDDFENVSSPSWPGTPNPSTASSGQQKGGINEILQKQLEMGEEPERKPWLERLFNYMDDRGSPIQVVPTISKNIIDLYRLYILTKERGGLMEVTKSKKWREISTQLNLGTSSSAGFTLKKNYCRFIFPSECKYELGGLDPGPILAMVEAPQKKDSKRAGQDYRPGYDGYGMHPGMAGEMHQGPMMPPNVSMMPANSGMPSYGQQGMMGNQNVMGGQGMMHNQGMMGNQGMMAGQQQGMMGVNQGMMGSQGMMPGMMGGNQSMMGGSQMQASIPGGGMMGGNQAPRGEMMPNSSMGSNMPNHMQGQMGRRPTMPSSYNDSAYEHDPSSKGGYPPGHMGSQQMPPYSGAMQQGQQQPQNNMGNNAYGYNRPPGATPGSTPPFSSTSMSGGSADAGGGGMGPNASAGFPPKPSGPEGFSSNQQQQPSSAFNGNSRPPSQPFSDSSTSQGPITSNNTQPQSMPPGNRPGAPGSVPPISQQPSSVPGGVGQQQPPPQQQQQPQQDTGSSGGPNYPNRFGSPLQSGPQRPTTPHTPQQQGQDRSGTPLSQQQPSAQQPPQPSQQMPPHQQQQPAPPVGGNNSHMGSGGQPVMGPQQQPQQPYSSSGMPPHQRPPVGYPGPTSQGQQQQQMDSGYHSGSGAPGQQQPTSQQGGSGYPLPQQPQTNSPGPAMYPGGKPAMYGAPPTSQHKQPMMGAAADYPRRDQGYGMQSYQAAPVGNYYSYGPQIGGSVSMQENMHPDMRRQDTWPMMPQRYGGVNQPPSMPPSSMPPGGPVSNLPPSSTIPPGASGPMPPSMSGAGGLVPPPHHHPHPHHPGSNSGMPPTVGSSGMGGPSAGHHPMPPGGMTPGSTAASYNNMYHQRMSQGGPMTPHRQDKAGYYPGTPLGKMGPGKTGSVPFPQKKDISFPSDCVESTHPQVSKRKRLSHRHIGPVDPWRLLMALRSGLLVETTWALDVMTILLFEESTVVYFGLQHLPGLMDALLDHFRCYLIQIFGSEEFDKLEVKLNQTTAVCGGGGVGGGSNTNTNDMPALEKCEASSSNNAAATGVDLSIVKVEKAAAGVDLSLVKVEKAAAVGVDLSLVKGEKGEERNMLISSDSDSDDESEEDSDEEERVYRNIFAQRGVKRKLPVELPEYEKLCEPGNFTLRTRNGKSVKIEAESIDQDIAFDEKLWDTFGNFNCSKADFELGKGNISLHINTHMESDHSMELLRRRFFRHPKDRNFNKVINSKNKQEQQQHTGDKNAQSSLLSKCDSETCRDPHYHSQQHCTSSDQKMNTLAPSTHSSTTLTTIKEEKIDSHHNQQHHHIDDHCKAEQSSNCSSDSGIHVKSETSEVLSDIHKFDGDDTTAHHHPETTSKPSIPSSDSNVNIVKLENGNKELQDFKDFINDSNENDKKYLCKLKHKMDSGNEDNEEYRKDELPLCKLTDAQEELSRRCICISNIFRSLSFIPGNDREMAKHRGLMTVLGKLLLHNHKHMKRSRDSRTFDREVDSDVEDAILDDVTDHQWWWPTLDALRENVLVVIANISGQLNLSVFPEEICMPILDGLLHWAVCPSAYAQDAMPTMTANSVLSPNRLVLETLCKLCVTEINVDLILATPPFNRIVALFGNLIKLLADESEQVTREFSVVLLSFLVQGDSSAARAIALQHPAISLLLDFIESAEQNALKFVNLHGVHALKDNPDMIGTTPDMLRKAAKTLHHLSKVAENRSLFIPKQERILNLVMSQVLDKKVVTSLSSVLLHCAAD